MNDCAMCNFYQERESSKYPDKRFRYPYPYPGSPENSELCEISGLLLFVSYFASQNKEIQFGNYFFDVCCV